MYTREQLKEGNNNLILLSTAANTTGDMWFIYYSQAVNAIITFKNDSETSDKVTNLLDLI